MVAVIGPNGAGKSTLVRALAGIVPLDEGRVVCDGETWDGDGRRLETRRRDVGMAFQQDLLFPHLSALANVAFGPRSRGAGRRDAERVARAWLTRLGVEDLADRRPAQLSGGQAQRVADRPGPGHRAAPAAARRAAVLPRRRASPWRCASSCPGTSRTSTASPCW